MSAPDKCPKCGAGIRAGWRRETWFECESSIHTPDEIGTPRFVSSPICVERQRDQLAAQNASLRDLVREAYEEGADDGAMDRDNFLRSNAKSALDDLE